MQDVIKQFGNLKVSKKNRYEKLPLEDGDYLILGVGRYHGMSVTDTDYFNTKSESIHPDVLLVRCNGSLLSTKPFTVRIEEVESLIKEGYITPTTQKEAGDE